MNPTALALMTPKFRKMAVEGFLNARYPKVAKAQAASRTVTQDGAKDHRIFLWANKHPGCQIPTGRCQETTMALFVDAGLWEHKPAVFRNGNTQATEYWYRVASFLPLRVLVASGCQCRKEYPRKRTGSG